MCIYTQRFLKKFHHLKIWISSSSLHSFSNKMITFNNNNYYLFSNYWYTQIFDNFNNQKMYNLFFSLSIFSILFSHYLFLIYIFGSIFICFIWF